MSRRSALVAASVALLILTLGSCKKEFFTDAVPSSVADTVYVGSFAVQNFKRDSVDMDTLGWSLEPDDSVRVPFTLQPGDRIIHSFQFGLQMAESCPAGQGLVNVRAATILSNSPSATPVTGDVLSLHEQTWESAQAIQQFEVNDELVVTGALAAPSYIRPYLKVWSSEGCAGREFDISNRSLSVIIVHER